MLKVNPEYAVQAFFKNVSIGGSLYKVYFVDTEESLRLALNMLDDMENVSKVKVFWKLPMSHQN